ncbi:DUF2188 domain-containing protein [Microlunatus soli]|uniref:DUF2188 domain-containing protein n=1 Tax=Microlunatus soli TaxID=630515 RepID=A0A1H1NC31_9ACTN|nr:DUF2188 domain-containing protein [Microlunatus soli]SDR96483.1 hypothetical protein SAMN04489812_0464 [Microlunatus soli]
MGYAQFHVVPESDLWKVESNGRSSTDHNSPAAAIKAAEAEADLVRPSQVIIHGHDGHIDRQQTYDTEPFPPSG